MDDFFRLFNFLKTQSQESGDYRLFKYSMLYIKQKYDSTPKNIKGRWPKDWKIWMETLGYKNVQGFLRRMTEWVALRGEIPIKFIELLGTDVEQLEKILHLDQDAYEEALHKPFMPRYFQVRWMATVYPTYDLPLGISEAEAIEFVQNHLKNSKIPNPSGLINSRLKSIWIFPGKVFIDYYHPNMIIKKNTVLYVRQPTPGTVRIG